MLPDVTVDQFFGLNNAAKNLDDLKRGESPDALNWITSAAPVPDKKDVYFGDNIQLRRGSIPIATSLLSSGFVSGLGVGVQQNGTQVPIFSIGRHLFYYNATSQSIVEIGSSVLPATAANDDVAIIPYQNLADYAVFVSSPHSSFYKILTANPSDIIDLQSNQYRGYFTMNLGRAYLWNISPVLGRPNSTDLFISWGDGDTAGVSPPFYAKTGIQGKATDGTSTQYTDTLVIDTSFENVWGVQIAAFVGTPIGISGITKANPAVITVSDSTGFNVGDVVMIQGVSGMTQINNQIDIISSLTPTTITLTYTDSSAFSNYSSGGSIGLVEQLVDDQNGNLVSTTTGNNAGSVNYATGAIVANFQVAPVNSYHLSYAYYEDYSSNEGPLQFTPETPSSAIQSIKMPQPGVGPFMNAFFLSGLVYCFHQNGVYQLQLTNNSTFYDATGGTVAPNQQIFAQNAGIPYWRAGYETADGILYLDIYNFAYPTLRILELQYSSSSVNPLVIPRTISDALDLSAYTFSKGVVQEWGDYYLLAGMGSSNGVPDAANDNIFVMNKKTGYWDRTDYRASCMGTYLGALLAGDSISPNLQILFSGFDDNGFNINNYWKSGPDRLGRAGIKTIDKIVVKGLIQPSQVLQIYVAYDLGTFVLLDTIYGNGPYVNIGTPIEVGGPTVGSNIVGGGGTVYAYSFEKEIEIGSDLFDRIQVMFEGASVGFLQIDEYTWKQIHYHGSTILSPLVE